MTFMGLEESGRTWGNTAIVSFDTVGLQECAKSDLEILPAILERLREPTWDVPLEVINRIQAELIKAINDVWERICSLNGLHCCPISSGYAVRSAKNGPRDG